MYLGPPPSPPLQQAGPAEPQGFAGKAPRERQSGCVAVHPVDADAQKSGRFLGVRSSSCSLAVAAGCAWLRDDGDQPGGKRSLQRCQLCQHGGMRSWERARIRQVISTSGTRDCFSQILPAVDEVHIPSADRIARACSRHAETVPYLVCVISAFDGLRRQRPI